MNMDVLHKFTPCLLSIVKRGKGVKWWYKRKGYAVFML